MLVYNSEGVLLGKVEEEDIKPVVNEGLRKELRTYDVYLPFLEGTYLTGTVKTFDGISNLITREQGFAYGAEYKFVKLTPINVTEDIITYHITPINRTVRAGC